MPGKKILKRIKKPEPPHPFVPTKTLIQIGFVWVCFGFVFQSVAEAIFVVTGFFIVGYVNFVSL